MILIKNRPLTGFFSNFNAALDWAWYSKHSGEPIYVHWDGLTPNDPNLFEQLFTQKYSPQETTRTNNAFYRWSPYRTDEVDNKFRQDVGGIYDRFNGWLLCNGAVYSDPEFGRVRHQRNALYNEYFSLRPNVVEIADFDRKTLGVHYRFGLHYFLDQELKVNVLSKMSQEEFDNVYLTQIEKIFSEGQFEQIYLGCDQEGFLAKCEAKFKNRVVYPIHQRSHGQDDWLRKTVTFVDNTRGVIKTESLLGEFVYALTDTLNLSKCHYFLGSPSNLTFNVVTFNPDLDFQIVDHLKTVLTD